mmetsp:Transcript_7747/g.15106  ORF Transcript_7747/g.15106 Transcript_7747/m.15106 type:complete len:229 (+) Transcript_7747:700-1386(+)
MGVLYDNLKEYDRSGMQYMKFLEICGKMNDHGGAALAFNCLGIAFYLMALQEQKGRQENLKKSLIYHKKHRDMGDATGKSIAHTNLGIIFDLLGDLEKGSSNHESALHHAIRAGDRHLQAVAVGHLGLSGCACKDYDTARACMEKYLELTSQLGEIEAREHALLHLGYIAKQQGDGKSAVAYYHAGLDSAIASQNSKNISKAKVQIGIIMGNTLLEDQMEKISAAFAR